MLSPHGSYELDIRDRILICHVHGSWNFEGIRIYTAEVKSIVSSWPMGPWCRIVDMEDFNLTIPDAESHLNEFIRWCDSAGCLGHLYVSRSILHKKHLENVVPPEDGPRLFATMDEAVLEAKRLLSTDIT